MLMEKGDILRYLQLTKKTQHSLMSTSTGSQYSKPKTPTNGVANRPPGLHDLHVHYPKKLILVKCLTAVW